ncbi:MAG: DUF4037 domain-containing protein [Chloroflexota bacterium]|nr:DUF4037 domain-containing protein [Chloroflexota bacterium]
MAVTSQGSVWRRSLARAIAPAYATNRKVAAIVLGGSTSRGIADRYSDIELGVFWHEPPTEEEREVAYHAAGGTCRTPYSFNDLELEEWSEEFLVYGVKLDLIHRTVATTTRLIDDVLVRYDTSAPKQHLLSTMQHAIPLAGKDLLEAWQVRLKHYPDELARAVVRQHLSFGPKWWLEMLAERGEILPLYDVFCKIGHVLLAVLLGLNRRYHPGDKWVDQTVATFLAAPPRFVSRLNSAFHLDPMAGVQVMNGLVEEVIVLIETHMPEIDTSHTRQRIEKRRSLWDVAPPTVPV